MNTLKSLYIKLLPILLMLSIVSCGVNLGPPLPPPVVKDMAVPADLSPIICNDRSLIDLNNGTYRDSINGGCQCIPDNMRNKNMCRYCLPLPDVIKIAKATFNGNPTEYVMYSDRGCLEPIIIALYNDKYCGFTTEPPGSRRFYLFSGINTTLIPFYVKSWGTCVSGGFTENSVNGQREVPITIFSEVS